MMYTWIAYLFLSLFVSSGNFLVVATLVFTPSLHSQSNLLMLSLSVSDLCMGLVLLPMEICEMLHASWTTTIEYCRISHDLILFNLSASLFHIVIIAIDRYTASFHPFRYEAVLMKKWTLVSGITLTWLTSLTLAFLPSIGLGSSSLSRERKLSGLCMFNETLHPHYLLFYATFICFGCFIVVTVLYSKLYFLARSHIRRIAVLNPVPLAGSVETSKMTVESLTTISCNNKSYDNNTNRPNRPHGRHKRMAMELKAVKVMIIVVGALFICWLPAIVTIIDMALCSSCVDQVAIATVIFLVYLNSGLNPLIYYNRLRTYRQATKRMIRKILRMSAADLPP